MNNQDTNTNDLFQEIEHELEQQQMMLNADDFTQRNINLTRQLYEQSQKQQSYKQDTPETFKTVSGQSQNSSYYAPSFKFNENKDIYSDNTWSSNGNNYNQNQIKNEYQINMNQNNNQRVNYNNQIQMQKTNNVNYLRQSGDDNNNYNNVYAKKQDDNLKNIVVNEMKEDKSVTGSNTQNVGEFEEKQKQLYFQSVNDQQEALKNMLSSIQKQSPKKISENQFEQNDNYMQSYGQHHRNIQRNEEFNEYNQNNNHNNQYQNQFQMQQQNKNQLNNQNYHMDSNDKMSFGPSSKYEDRNNLINDHNDNNEQGENFNNLNQKFFQQAQTLQEQIKEILSQKNKRQKIDSDEDIQTIDEQSRESSLDNTNRNSSIHTTGNYNLPLYQKEEIEQPISRQSRQQSASQNKNHSQQKRNSINAQANNQKKVKKPETNEKNQMQLQYERALDFKYNGIGNKKKQTNNQPTQQQIPTQNDNYQLDPMHPKHIFLKLSPKASQVNAKFNLAPSSSTVLQNSNHAFSSTQSSTYMNNGSSYSQKDEIASFKRQINSLISKEQEIKTFFSGSNSTTPNEINNKMIQNQQQQINNIQNQSLTEKTYPTTEQRFINDGNQQTLTERISSGNRLSHRQGREDQGGNLNANENLFDRLMKQNLGNVNKNGNTQGQAMKRSSSAKQVVINTDLNECSPNSNAYHNKDKKISSTKNSAKKPCIKQTFNPYVKQQINAFQDVAKSNLQISGDQPLLVSDLSSQNSPPFGQRELQNTNAIPSGYNNKLYTPSQLQFGKQQVGRNGPITNATGTPNSANLSMYQNINHTSIMSLRQQIESKIFRNKDQSSTLASFSAGQAHDNSYEKYPLNNSHQNSKKVIAIHNQLINSDKPTKINYEENNSVLQKNNEPITSSRGRFPLPLPPQKNSQNLQNSQTSQNKQSTEKRSNSLPKASYESLVQSALMRQQVFKTNEDNNNNQENQDISNNQIKNPLTSQREKSPLDSAKIINPESSQRSIRGVNVDAIGNIQKQDQKKRTDSLQARKSSLVQKTESNNNQPKKQGMLRQSSERTLKTTNNNQYEVYNQQPSLFYKPSQHSPGLNIQKKNQFMNSQSSQQLRANDSGYRGGSNTLYDENIPSQNEQKSLIEMDIIERNNAWLTQRKIKNEQRKIEQEKKEIEGCTFKPSLRAKSPNLNTEREEFLYQNSIPQYSLSNVYDNQQQLMNQNSQSDLYQSYFNKSSVMKSGKSRLIVEGYSQQHQLNLLRKSSLNSAGQQKVKQMLQQNYMIGYQQ